MIENIKDSLKSAHNALQKLISNDVTLLNIESAVKILIETFESGHRVFSCGNGGSMCDAMHLVMVK